MNLTIWSLTLSECEIISWITRAERFLLPIFFFFLTYAVSIWKTLWPTFLTGKLFCLHFLSVLTAQKLNFQWLCVLFLSFYCKFVSQKTKSIIFFYVTRLFLFFTHTASINSSQFKNKMATLCIFESWVFLRFSLFLQPLNFIFLTI